jgi:hypothetical protein
MKSRAAWTHRALGEMPTKSARSRTSGEAVTWLPQIPFVGWLWLSSGLPVGLVLMWSPPSAWIAFFTFAVLMEVGHALSPIVFAWTNPAYRTLIFKYPRKYVVLPGAFLVTACAIGAATSLGWTSFVKPAQDLTGQNYAFTDLRNPFGMMVSVYWWWNVYHFGMQNFGVLAMCRTGRSAQRRRLFRVGRWDVLRPRPAAVLCLAVTAFGMVILPKLVHSPELGILFYCLFFVNHWVVAIGLPSHVESVLDRSRPRLHAWGFALGVLLLGTVGFVWSAPAWVWRAWGYAIPAQAPDYALVSHVVPVVLSLRFGLSFVHFLYDRNIWRMSDPEVRAIIGPAFAPRTVGLRVVPSQPRLRPVA